jgi:hypothetical protein
VGVVGDRLTKVPNPSRSTDQVNPAVFAETPSKPNDRIQTNPSAPVSGLPSVAARPTSRPHNFRSPHEHFPRLPVADGHGPPPAHGARRRRRGGRGGAGGGGGPGGGRHAAGAGARNRHDVLRVHGSRGGRALRPPRRAPRRRVAAPEPRPRRFRPRARQGPSAGPVIPPLSFLRPTRAPSRRIVFFLRSAVGYKLCGVVTLCCVALGKLRGLGAGN